MAAEGVCAASLGLGVEVLERVISAWLSSSFVAPLDELKSWSSERLCLTLKGGRASGVSTSAKERFRALEGAGDGWSAGVATVALEWAAGREGTGSALDGRRVEAGGECCCWWWAAALATSTGGGERDLVCLMVLRSVAGRMKLAIALSIVFSHSVSDHELRKAAIERRERLR